MLAPKKMSRLLIVASKDQLTPVVRELHRFHRFHIEDFVADGREGYEGFAIGTPLAGASEASSDLIKVRSIENTFSIHAEDVTPTEKRRQADLRAVIERDLPALEREVVALNAQRSKLDAAIKECEQKIAEITLFALFPVDLSLYSGYERFTVFAGTIAKDVKIPEPAEYAVSGKGKAPSFIVAVVPNERRSETERILGEAGFSAVPIPAESGMPDDKIRSLKGRIAELKSEISHVLEKLEAIRGKQTGFLVACEEILKADVEQAEAPLRFATTGLTFVAEGWVPSENVSELSVKITEITGGKALVQELPIGPHDTVPVEYNNPSFARPSQVFMDIYARPSYTEIDPTLMLSIIFPIFFGLILGDVGYGLILLVMFLALRGFVKGEDGQYLLRILRNASISSIIFGLLYSEFLGFELPWAPIMFSRHLGIGAAEGGEHVAGPMIPALMIMAVWIGILHITLGRGLGMINHARQDHGDHRIKAVMANLGWLLVMWGILMVIWSMFGMPYMPDLTKLSVIFMGLNAAAIAGAVMLVAGVLFIARDNPLEVVELPTIISHVLSYARIVAVGLSSVAIAMVVNYIAIGMLIEPQLERITIVGVVIIIAGIFVFLLGHAMNTALGILGGGLHSIRLHYVEFFTKFYKGGGLRYNPFGLKRIFTEE